MIDSKKVQILLNMGTIIQGMVLSNPQFSGQRPVVLVIHGWTSSMAKWPSRINPLVNMGYLVLLFDMRAHGETGGEIGTFSIHDNLNDCKAAFEYLVSLENTDLSNISVIGSSYGGYLASLLTREKKIDHLVLNVPALYPNEIFDSAKGLLRSEETNNYREILHDSDDNFALQAIHDFKGDLLFIGVENDEVLSPAVLESYQRAATVPFLCQVIAGSDHAMRTPTANEERIRIQAEWFEKYIVKE